MYLNKAISKKELPDFENLIPENYMPEIRAGKMFAGRVVDLVGGEETPLVTYVSYAFAGWLELVWLSFYEDDLPVDHANLLRYLIRVESDRRGIPLKGVYMDVHYDEVKDPVLYRQMLIMANFECREIYGPTYELTFSQIKEGEFLKKAAKLHKCVPLAEAEDQLFTDLAAMIREDERPAPVGAYLKWDDYLQQDSLICLKDGKPCGALLISMKKECLVLECAYVTEKTALSAMLGTAYTMLSEKYDADTRILVPVVLKKTGQIVERMAPEAKRVRLLEAIQWF